MSKITVYEQGNLCIDYEILSRQCAELNFKDGKVEYFSVSTQRDTADTIEDAIRNILEADEKYDGKPPMIAFGTYKLNTPVVLRMPDISKSIEDLANISTKAWQHYINRLCEVSE